MPAIQIALVGDYREEVLAHRAINRCFDQGAITLPNAVKPHWLDTETIVAGDEDALKGFGGIWCVPGSPYRHTEGALWAIQYARSRGVPFLGTCGGYQHALLEYARNVLGLKQAGHSELDSAAPLPLLNRMQCGLIEQLQKVIVQDDAFRAFYGADSGIEGFHCSYGLNPEFESLFNGSPMQIVARSEAGEARAFLLKGHPFFVGTHFQPERRVLTGTAHPLVAGFMCAAAREKARGTL